MTFTQTQWVWMNGEVVPWGSATTHVSAHGLHYGTGVFEGIRCYATNNGPALFRVEEHLARFFASAQIHGIEIPFSSDHLREAITRVIRENGFNACYVRPTIFVDTLPVNVNPKLAPKYLPNQRCGMTRKEFVEMLFAFSLIVSSKIWN